MRTNSVVTSGFRGSLEKAYANLKTTLKNNKEIAKLARKNYAQLREMFITNNDPNNDFISQGYIPQTDEAMTEEFSTPVDFVSNVSIGKNGEILPPNDPSALDTITLFNSQEGCWLVGSGDTANYDSKAIKKYPALYAALKRFDNECRRR